MQMNHSLSQMLRLKDETWCDRYTHTLMHTLSLVTTRFAIARCQNQRNRKQTNNMHWRNKSHEFYLFFFSVWLAREWSIFCRIVRQCKPLQCIKLPKHICVCTQCLSMCVWYSYRYMHVCARCIARLWI